MRFALRLFASWPRKGIYRIVCIAFAASWGGGCASSLTPATPDNSDAPTIPSAGEFIAFAADFAGYRTWNSTVVVDDGGVGGAVHTQMTFIEYTNRQAFPEPIVFPQGAILVKEADLGDPSIRAAFAMVKRGGTYNAEAGVNGWEWFELQNGGDGGPEIVWRGSAPPSSQTYSGNINGDCNTCHARAAHDGVFAQ